MQCDSHTYARVMSSFSLSSLPFSFHAREFVILSKNNDRSSRKAGTIAESCFSQHVVSEKVGES